MQKHDRKGIAIDGDRDKEYRYPRRRLMLIPIGDADMPSYFYCVRVIDSKDCQMDYGFNAVSAENARAIAAEKAREGGLVAPFEASIVTDRFGNSVKKPRVVTFSE